EDRRVLVRPGREGRQYGSAAQARQREAARRDCRLRRTHQVLEGRSPPRTQGLSHLMRRGSGFRSRSPVFVLTDFDEGAELEVLHRLPWRRVPVPPLVHQLEVGSEKLANGFGTMPRHWQAAAFFRTIEREGADDGMATRLQRLPKATDIGCLLFGCTEEVKGGAVVPDI